MRLTLVISSMGAGGAERVMSIMANYWSSNNRDVTLLTLDDSSTKPFYKLDSRIKHISLELSGTSKNIFSAILNNVKRVYTLRKAIIKSKPDAIISFVDSTNVLCILATRWTNISVIVSEHNDPTMMNIGKVWETLRNITYPLADRVVLLNERARKYYKKNIQKIAVVIPNPVLEIQESCDGEEVVLKKPVLMAMGRFGREKGFDYLLNAYSSIINDVREWPLIILGDGQLRGELERLRKKLGLDGLVTMPGVVSDPYAYLRHADIFVLSSRHEGFPMALCEAMACGVPVISFDCKTGPREIIRDGVDGILVPAEDTKALADAMRRLIHDGELRKSMSLNAKQVVERFGVEKIMRIWEGILPKLI